MAIAPHIRKRQEAEAAAAAAAVAGATGPNDACLAGPAPQALRSRDERKLDTPTPAVSVLQNTAHVSSNSVVGAASVGHSNPWEATRAQIMVIVTNTRQCPIEQF
ncbi:uncharacterized protein MYCFIDRAFT_211171 [Pseudocercospora fijiensis CIRAD86]|uniref:Uncharacterized protein n=1 Tax=Pseudocercospora fijiensis (strain CIRAD86) TaxID=383855 RepID=M2ZV11_PSEFD|nr:uncharacterized protein MYCFIDRAFT_211171 [Pseudocercospora fijiensis CIRAD86]EME82834.1 hypothetical protein MYCFIDRAFT_211171 [Pseudocercospora fijiensis CIRAD86]